MPWCARPALAMAMLQFAVLGTLGDLLGAWLAARRVHWPLGGGLWWRKMAKWALLAVPIKLAFVGFCRFFRALVATAGLPQGQPAGAGAGHLSGHQPAVRPARWCWATAGSTTASAAPAAGSTSTAACGAWPGSGCPHAVTFALPDWCVGLAALWSVALGLILGMYSRCASAGGSDLCEKIK